MNKSKLSLAVGLLWYSTISTAGTITLLWDGNPWNPSPPAGPFNYSVTTGGNTYTGSVAPDRYHGTITAVSGVDPFSIGDGTGVPEGLFTYCYELTQYFSPGSSYVYNVVPGAVTSATLDFLGAVNSLNPGFGSFGWLNPANANFAAAVQIGIWETLYDPGAFNVATGNFLITGLGSGAGSVGGYLQQFSGAMSSTVDLSPLAVARLSNTDAQDQITGIRTTSLLVPEPGTLALLALGAVVGCATRGKGKRR